MKITYTDSNHAYYQDGKRCKSISAVAKVPVDSYNLELWSLRQVAIGLALDRNLIENVAVDVENRDALNAICEQAKRVASAHRAADRGTQMHKVLELVLLDREDRLLTEQQRRDAQVLKRTLDRYGLKPHANMAERIVSWPDHLVAGRFDAILEKCTGGLVLTDLKSGPNAVAYPQATAIQLALYARAPLVSQTVEVIGDKTTVTDWGPLPEQLERRYAYVLLVEPSADVGTLHEINIEHGWAGARSALEIIRWRKEFKYGREIATQVPPSTIDNVDPWTATAVMNCPTIEALRNLWDIVAAAGGLTDDFKAAATARATELSAVPV